MKKFLLLSFLSIGLILGAKKTKALCYSPAYNVAFSQTLRTISVQNTDHQKALIAKRFFANNCFGTAQLNQVVYTLNSDVNRYNLAIDVFHLMEDTSGFYQIGYALNSRFYKSEFNNFIRQQQHNRGYTHGRPNYPSLNFPNLNYPDVNCYRGLTCGSGFIDERSFNKLAIMLSRERSDFAKKQRIDGYFQQHYFSTAQFMKMLTLVNSLQYRYDLAVIYYGLVYDIENAFAIEQVFGSSHYANRYRFYLQQNIMPNHRPNTNSVGVAYRPNGRNTYRAPMVVSDLEMQQILASIKNEPFNSKKSELAKTIIQSKQAFTSSQIAQIIAQFSFDSYKLDVAKFAYQFTVDRDNYYLVANQLTFSSNKSELLSFIRNNP
jgi:hypothetical protein